jgi:Cytochrome c oxidase subunit IV
MAEPLPQSSEVPRAGEAIHLPGPSYIPVIVALGVTIAVVGVVLNWFVFGAGVLITLISVGRWIGDTRRDIADLPLEHQTH